MRKALIALILAALFTLSACGNSTASSPDSAGGSSAADLSEAETEKPEDAAPAQPEAPDTEPEADDTPFAAFGAALDKAGYSYETNEMLADHIGALAGTTYKFDFGYVEMYQFEDGPDELAKTIERGDRSAGPYVLTCYANGSLVMYTNLTENEETIAALFQAL